MKKEAIALFFIFLFFLLLISLLSFNPEDPFFIGSLSSSSKVHNYFGLSGALIAGLLFGCFGLGSLWLPFLVAEAALRFLFSKKHPFPIVLRVSGGLLLILSSGVLAGELKLASFFFGLERPAVLTGVLRNFLYSYLNFEGMLFVLFFFLLIAFLLSFGLSFKYIFSLLSLFFKYLSIFFIFLKDLGHAFLKKISVFFLFLFSRKDKKLSLDKPVKKDREVKITAKGPLIDKKEDKKLEKPLKDMTKSLSSPKDTFSTFIEGAFNLPSPLKLLSDIPEDKELIDEAYLRTQSDILEQKLSDFGVSGRVSKISSGPVITTFEYEPAPGIKISRVANLADDLALALRALSIRIVAPIPGRAAIGIELPNSKREMVYFKELVLSEAFSKSPSPLSFCLGKDIRGGSVVVELDRMPHLLIAGATGSGKSVGLNVMIASLLFKSSPEDLRFIMIDPKRIELSVYDGIPHLISPVVTDMKQATAALFWAVKEMERRYELLAEFKCRNIKQYNKEVEKLSAKDKKKAEKEEPEKEDEDSESSAEKLPYIVIVIDELADLMMVSSKDVELALARLAQMARASGIHIVLATQRPSVDVLTGLIKANFPTRIAFQVSSRIDSRTVLDTGGAESLLGNGDMLFIPPGTASIQRIHGAYIGENDLERLIAFLKEQGSPDYLNDLDLKDYSEKIETRDEEDADPLYDEALALVARTGQASISMVQRNLRIGYNRAARIIEYMEREGVVGPADGARPREVLVKSYEDK